MTTLILPVVALLLIYGALGRYRGDFWARLAGVTAALGGTLGVSLALPEVNGSVSGAGFAALAVVGIAAAVGGTVVAESRRRARQPER